MIYATGSDAFATSSITSAGRALLDDADAAAMRATLSAQESDATLTALAGVSVSADQMIYATGSDAFATTSLTAAGRALLDDADAAAQRQTLSAQEADATLTALAGVSVGADQLIYATGSDAFATTSLTAAGRALLDDSDVATMRGTLGLGTAATSASSAFLASASPSVSSGTLTLTSSGLTFSDGTTQTTASSGGGGGGGLSNVVDDTSPELGGDLDVLARSIVSSSGRDISLSPDGTGSVIIKGGTAAAKLQLECEQGSHSTSIQSPPHSASADYTLTLPTSLSAGALYTSSGGQLSTGDLPVADGGTGSSNASDARTALGVAIGSDVQAYDAGLNSIAGLTTAADKMIYTTGSDTYAVATITAAGRAILDDADAAAQRTSLGLGTMATAATSDYLPLSGGTLTGNVGIEKNGATSLTLTRTNGASNFAESTASGGNGEQLTIKSNESNQTSGFTAFNVGGSERVRIDNSGNIGIGTSSPGEPLHVAGNSVTAAQIVAESIATSQYSGGGIALMNGATANASHVLMMTYIRDSDSSDSIFSINQVDDNRGYLKTLGQYDLSDHFWRFLTNDAERMRIDSAGNVGIGTTSPSEPLEVAGKIKTTSGGVEFPDGTTQTTAAAPPGTVGSAVDGTATVPAFSFTSDNNTGLFRDGSGTVKVTSDGTEELTLLRASQAQAEAGTNNSVMMTPLRTAQAIQELSPKDKKELKKMYRYLAPMVHTDNQPGIDRSYIQQLNQFYEANDINHI